MNRTSDDAASAAVIASRLRARRAFLTGGAALAALVLAGCETNRMVMTTQRADPVSAVSIAEARIALNAMRDEQGLPHVSHDSLLQAVAEEQVQLMARAGEISHRLTEADGFTARLRRNGYYGAAGENLAGGPPTLATAIEGWMLSPSHRRTMVNPDYVKFGIAITRGPSTLTNTYGTYWALILGVETPDWFVPPR